jgi:hypothetical protein
MKRKALLALVVVCALCVSLAGLGLGSLLNTVTFNGQIGPGSHMNAVTLNMGYILNGSSGGSGPSGNGSPIDANETIVLAIPANVTIAFDNVSNVENAFTVFDVLIQFDQSATPIVQGSISESLPSFTISNVPSGTYEIFVGYTYTAGPNSTTFSIPIDISA